MKIECKDKNKSGGLTSAFQVRMETWEKVARPLFVFALILLALVLVPFIGKGVNGARRWISVGFMSFQPSELAKLSVLLYAASYMVRKMEVKEDFFKAVTPMGVAVVLVGVLLLAEPDMGAFMVIVVIAMGILFLGGVNGRMFLLSCAVLVATFVMVIVLSPEKRVLIPDLRAGCSLASSITGADVRLIKQRYPGLPVVTYVNTTADVKAETDICCTSANAVQVVDALGDHFTLGIAPRAGADTVAGIDRAGALRAQVRPPCLRAGTGGRRHRPHPQPVSP